MTLVVRSAFVACILLSCQSLLAQTKSPAVTSRSAAVRPSLSDPASEKKLDALLQKMTLEEKVGQLVQYSAGQPTGPGTGRTEDRKSTRLNSSHRCISYAVFCLKKKKT